MKATLRAVALLLLSSASAGAQYLDARRAEAGRMAHEEWALAVLFTPDGRQVVSAGLDARVRFWDAQTGAPLRELRAPRPLLCLALSADGRRVAAGDAGGSVHVWDAGDGKLERELKADAKTVNAVAFAPDGATLAAGGSEGKARVWRAGAAAPAAEVEAGGDVVSLAFSPKQAALLAVGALNRKEPERSGVGLWRWPDGARAHFFRGSPAPRALAFSPDGRLLAAAQFERRTLLSVVPEAGASFEASVRALGESDEPGAVIVWEAEAGRERAAFTAELGASALAFSDDGSLLASAGDHGAMLFDTEVFLERGRVESQRPVGALAVGALGTLLALARERAAPGEGGAEKLFDPFYVAAVMTAKEGVNSGAFAARAGASTTGGSSVEVWRLAPRGGAEQAKLWEATRLLKRDETAARAAYEKVVAEHPTSGEARRQLAVLLQKSDRKRTRELVESAVRVDPACAGCHRTLGDLLHNAEEFAAAAASYRRALELNPESGLVRGRLAGSHSRLAVARLRPGDDAALKEARRLLEEALALRPAEAHYLSNLSTVYYFAGDFDTSIRMLKEAARLRPDHARVYYNLGHSYRQKGMIEEAVRAYRRYVAMGEAGEEARVERARKIIEELTKK